MRNVRIWFTKDNSAKYISHLDLNRCMDRVIHRAKLPIWYTEGFNPHAFMTFALPLSLGSVGKRESMDIRLIEDISNDDVMEKLNECLPKDIRVFDVTEPVMKPKEITYALFEIKLNSPDRTIKELSSDLKSLFDMETILIDKKTKSGIKEIDIKPDIFKYEIKELDKNVVLNLILPAGSVKNINPNLVTKALAKYKDIKIFSDVTRIDIYNKNLESFR